MLEGLEISEVIKSHLIVDNKALRFDSEYYKRKYLKEDLNRMRFENKFLGNIAYITDGQHGYHEVDNNSIIRHLTAKNAKGWFANDIDADRIAEWVDENNKRSSLCKNDLILSTRGTVGLCAIVDEEILPANIDQDVARIKFNSFDMLPTVVLAYLNSDIGQDWLQRNQTGMVQQGIALWRIRELPIPIFSIGFQKSIDRAIGSSKIKKDLSSNCYFKSEALLFQSIGLQDFKLNTDAVNIKSFKESFGISGRLDAEYYQKKYEDYIRLVKNYQNGWKSLVNVCTIKDSNISPEENTLYNYIELSDIGKTGDINGCTISPGKALPSRARRMVNTGDVIISSIEGSLGSCAIVQKEYEQSLCSTGFYIINSGLINSSTLLVLFKSDVIQNLLKQGCSGTILTAINKNEFLNIPIPLIENRIQKEIAIALKESFYLKKQSESLLDIAKRAVEMAIEEGEEKAMEWMEERRKEMGD